MKTMTTMNDLRRWIYETSPRERMLTEAGRMNLPEEVRKMNFMDVLDYVAKWKAQKWNDHLVAKGIEIFTCPDCGFTVKKEGHQCFKARSNQCRYEAGLPFRQTIQVVGQGSRVITKKKRQVDTDLALETYEKLRDNVRTQRVEDKNDKNNEKKDESKSRKDNKGKDDNSDVEMEDDTHHVLWCTKQKY